MTERHRNTAPKRLAHEERDVDVRLLGLCGLGLAILLGGSLALMVWLLDVFNVTPEGRGLRTAPVAETPPRPLAPRLQTSPSREMQEMLAAENARLQSYGWVDRESGIARIPIDRALALVATQGLPSWPDEQVQTTPEPSPEERGAPVKNGGSTLQEGKGR
jgi:hypothetical protein